MKKIMGLLVSIIIVTGLLTGCSGKLSETNEDSTGKNVSNTEESKWPRTITDSAGKQVILKEEPKRIALLHTMYLEHFLALGTPPTASAGSTTGNAMKALDEWETLQGYSEKADIIDLGSAREVNIEAVLESKPDVIVTFKGHTNLDKIYDQLIAIAPVVQIDHTFSWQDQILACAEIVGKEKEAEEFVTENESIISSSKDKISKYSDKTVALFRTDGKSFITHANKSYCETFGISKPEEYPDDYETLSLEAVAEMNPDYIIFQDFEETAKTFVKAQENSSVWNNLDAVKNGNIVYFDDSLNTFGPLAMRLTSEKLVNMFQK